MTTSEYPLLYVFALAFYCMSLTRVLICSMGEIRAEDTTVHELVKEARDVLSTFCRD